MAENSIQAFLLFLTPEEKKSAQSFISRRLAEIRGEEMDSVTCLIQDAKKAMDQVEAGRGRLRGAANNNAKIMARLYEESLVGYAQLLQWCNRAQASKRPDARNVQRSGPAGTQEGGTAQIEGKLSFEERRVFLLEPTEEEEMEALAYIQRRIQEVEFSKLTFFRDATQELLSYWDSTQGQTEGLMLDQFGSVNSVQGRRIIRERHEEMKQRTLSPFKAWFQSLNAIYLRKRKEEAEKAMVGAPRRTP